MSTHIPKKKFSLEEVKPQEKLYEVCIILKDIPGALAQAASLLADAGVNLKTGVVRARLLRGKRNLTKPATELEVTLLVHK